MIWITRTIYKHLKDDIEPKGYNNKLGFQKLTPSNIKNMDHYQEALDFAFNEDDILNIAITGAYGAGKSSVLKTYMGANPNKEAVHISLVDLQEVNGNDNQNRTDLNEAELEGKILNQLIHQINPKNITQTDFKIKTDFSKPKVITETLKIVLLLISLLYIFNFEKIKSAIDELDIFNLDIPLIILSIAGILSLLIITTYLYIIIRAQLRKPILKKINVQGNEFEVFEKDDDSYFNKHLNEILYLFRNSNVDAIIFEDIDRYDNNIIFLKLKEINYLINGKNNTNKMKFLYLIKDDLFNSKDRTKFFDFIMPIIPVIDSSNSYDKILKYFRKADKGIYLKELNNNFLRQISLYIDDMRLLKNIYNEYVIYHGRLQKIELNYNKLLSLIIYKNLFPQDFIDLQLNKGLVFDILNNKKIYIKERKDKIYKSVEELSRQLEKINNEHLNDLDELDTLYITTGRDNYTINGNYDIDYNTRLEYIKELKDPDAHVKVNIYSENVKTKISRLSYNDNYVKRKEIIQLKMDTNTNQIKQQISDLNLEKENLNSTKLNNIISKKNSAYVFKHQFENENGQIIKYKNIINNHYYPLIKYLLRNEYLNETYSDYLSYFYEEGLTINDKIFLRSITDEEAKEFQYPLKHPEKVKTYLELKNMQQKEALNFNLLTHLLQNNTNENYSSYTEPLLKQIRDNKSFEFVWDYIQQAPIIETFIRELNLIWVNIFVYLTSNNTINSVTKNDYIIYTIYYTELEDLIDMNTENCITNYISQNESFLNIQKPKVEKLISTFNSIGVSFEDVNYNIANKKLFSEVYKNELYKINFPMIKLILENIYEIPYSPDYIEKNYTLIKSQPKQPLNDYISKHINVYMALLLDNLSTQFKDSKENVIKILNNTNLEDNHKLQYIENLSTVINKIRDIEDDNLWEGLLTHNLIDYTYENIIIYYMIYSGYMDLIITTYINDNPKNINFEYTEIKEKYGDRALKFFEDAMNNNGLSNEKYKMILKEFNYCYEAFDNEELENEKMEILITLDIIGMSPENVEFIRSHYPDLTILFAGNDIEKYIDYLDEETLIEEEVLALLDKDIISTENKTKLIDKFPNEISISNDNYEESIELYIMGNKFDTNDLDYLIGRYIRETVQMKEAIEKLSVSHITYLIEHEYNLPYKLLLVLMQDITIDNPSKKLVVCNHFSSLKGTQVEELMRMAEFKEFASLFKQGRPKIKNTNENYKLLECFKDKEWITRFEEENGYYRAIGRDYSKIKD